MGFAEVMVQVYNGKRKNLSSRISQKKLYLKDVSFSKDTEPDMLYQDAFHYNMSGDSYAYDNEEADEVFDNGEEQEQDDWRFGMIMYAYLPLKEVSPKM